MQALNNIRVLDLSKVLAGPLCGQYLGNLGAQVTKVEPIGVGDDTRAWQPQREGESAELAVARDAAFGEDAHQLALAQHLRGLGKGAR